MLESYLELSHTESFTLNLRFIVRNQLDGTTHAFIQQVKKEKTQVKYC